MKHAIIAAFALAACATGYPSITITDTCRADLYFTADESFTPAERDAIVSGASDWAPFSNGRIQIAISFEPRAGTEPHIYRVVSGDPVVVARETEAGRTFWGWEATSGHGERAVYLIMDRIPAESWKPVITHELGHAAGLRWPACDPSKGEDCFHSDDPTALMCGWPRTNVCNNGVATLGPADLAFCRASCLCD